MSAAMDFFSKWILPNSVFLLLRDLKISISNYSLKKKKSHEQARKWIVSRLLGTDPCKEAQLFAPLSPASPAVFHRSKCLDTFESSKWRVYTNLNKISYKDQKDTVKK